MRTVPFTQLQEAVYNVERGLTPWTMQVEAATTTTLDPRRLRDAARTACETYPMAKARCRRSDGGGTAHDWILPAAPAEIPVEVVDGDAADLAALRRRYYGAHFDLTAEPPFGLLVVRGDGAAGGDRLCVRASHVPFDGVGALLVLNALLVAYRGGEPTAVEIDGTPQEVMARVRPEGVGRRLGLLGATGRRLGRVLDPPTRLRGDGDTSVPAGGWRYAHRHLDADATGRLVADRPDGVSVNDVLLAALHLTIDRWNADRGGDPGRIGVMMPINVRPAAEFYAGVGLYTLFDSVTTTPAHRRDAGTTMTEVAARTDAITATERQFGYLEWWRLLAAVAPPAVRDRVPALLFGPCERLLDTAILSNLGRIPALPELPDGDVVDPWVTPPCWPPTPVAIGAVTVGDRLHLGFRYDRSVFDADDAAALADRYHELLEAMLN